MNQGMLVESTGPAADCGGEGMACDSLPMTRRGHEMLQTLHEILEAIEMDATDRFSD